MSLHVSLYRDSKITNSLNQQVSHLIKKLPKVTLDLSDYNEKIGVNPDQQYHIDCVKSAFGKERTYTNFYHAVSDSHHEIEKIGASLYSRNYTVIVSLEDSLDYILHRLSGASMSSVRSLSNYTELSRDLMKVNLDRLDNHNFSSLLNLDTKLDSYLSRIYEEAGKQLIERGDSDVETLFADRLMKNILEESDSIISYLGFYYRQQVKEAAVRSKSYCSVVIASDEKMNDELIIESTGFDNCNLQARSFECREYFDKTELHYAN